MNPSIKLLDKFTQTCGHASDSAAARALHVQPSAVNNWRRERAHPNAEAVDKMCAAIGEPLKAWLPLIEAERARTPADRKVWLRLASAAATLALVLSFGLLNVQTVHAQGAESAAHNPGTLYIMSTLRRWLRRVGMFLASALRPAWSNNEILLEV